MEKTYLLYCRAGFEKDVIAEVNELWAMHNSLLAPPIFRATSDSGYLSFTSKQTEAQSNSAALPFAELIFARQLVQVSAQKLTQLPETDRAGPIAQALIQFLQDENREGLSTELMVESADSEQGNTLQPFCRSITAPLKAQLMKAGLRFDKKASQRVHVFFESYSDAWVGFSDLKNSSAYERGIPRLKFPPAAPSRSTLKLDEAFLLMMSEHERARYLKPGLSAVDLGACPGGWTYQLVQRGLSVTAVDHGKLDKSLQQNPRVRYEAANGLKYLPAKAVDWMVCDMIETPARVTEVALNWLSNEHCKHCVVTLKLPMKSRYAEVRRCLNFLEEGLKQSGMECSIRARHLYHNREEVTLLALRQ